MRRAATGYFKTPGACPRRIVTYNCAYAAQTVFDIKGVPGYRRERIEAAVVTGSKHASHASLSSEAWIPTGPFRGGFRLLITGPHGF